MKKIKIAFYSLFALLALTAIALLIVFEVNNAEVKSMNEETRKEDQTVTYNFSDSLRKMLAVDFLSVDYARHLPQLEQPLLVNQKIVSFLK